VRSPDAWDSFTGFALDTTTTLGAKRRRPPRPEDCSAKSRLRVRGRKREGDLFLTPAPAPKQSHAPASGRHCVCTRHPGGGCSFSATEATVSANVQSVTYRSASGFVGSEISADCEAATDIFRGAKHKGVRARN